MSRRCELQKTYYQKYGNYKSKGDGTYSDEYVKWLEDEILTTNPTLDLNDILAGIKTFKTVRLPKEWIKNEDINVNYMGGFITGVAFLQHYIAAKAAKERGENF